MSGAESPAHLKAVTDRLNKLIPNADRLPITGATHNMFVSHPAEFNTGVLHFIRSHSVETLSDAKLTTAGAQSCKFTRASSGFRFTTVCWGSVSRRLKVLRATVIDAGCGVPQT